MNSPGGPDVLQIGEVPTPEPGPGEVLVTVVAAGVNRADLMQRQGHYPPPPGASEVLGLEVSGRVAAFGADVDESTTGGIGLGQPCVALLAGGGYAEYVAVPAGQVLPPPPGMDLIDAGGTIEVAATVWSNLDQARLGRGEVFLVHGGAGGIGSFAIQYARSRGATVITTAGAKDKLDYCRELGAEHALSYREDWVGAVREITGGSGVDVVLDNMGAKYLPDHVDLLARNGRLVVIGLQGGAQGTLNLGTLLRTGGSVTATSLRGRPVSEKAEICRRVAQEVWPLLGDGSIRAPRCTRFPLDEARSAHERLESGDSLGKVVLEVQP